MTLTLDFWQLLMGFAGLMAFFLVALAGVWKLFIGQVEKRLDERFKAQDEARKAGQEAWHKEFQAHLSDERREAERLRTLEREVLDLKAELPKEYVRREDHIRGQSVLEAKLDALYNLFLRKGGAQ